MPPHGIQIEVKWSPEVGWSYRVLTDKENDWSGVAHTMAEAWEHAKERARLLAPSLLWASGQSDA